MEGNCAGADMCGPFQILQAGRIRALFVLVGHSVVGGFFAHISLLLRNCPRLFASVYPPVINTSGAASRPSRLLDSAGGMDEARPRDVVFPLQYGLWR
ncbi:hypothetical protein GCM10009589_19210 [Arthrobacter pascens]